MILAHSDGRNGLNFLSFSLSALHPQNLLFKSSGIWVVVQASIELHQLLTDVKTIPYCHGYP